MAALARLRRSSQCLVCFRKIANYDITDVVVPFHRQIRGKKKVGKPAPVMLNVQLLEDIPGYGAKGSFIPVAPGRMRNIFYPRKRAAYVTREQLQDLRKREIPIERDFTFGIDKPEGEDNQHEDSTEVPERANLINVQLDRLSAQKATEIISSSLPDILPFYRTAILSPEAESPTRGPPNANIFTSPSATESAGTAELPKKPQVVAIYGSVSVADIAEEVKAALIATEEGARIVLGPEDIKIIRNEGPEAQAQAQALAQAEADRIKILGDFEVDIRVKGGDAVRRTVRIIGQESL